MSRALETQGAEVLVFDLGGVLVDFRGFDALRSLTRPTPDADEIRTRWIASEAVSTFERGRIDAAEFARRFVEEWQLDQHPDAFLSSFRSWAGPVAPEGIALLEALAPSFELACLSNCNETHWEDLGETVRASFDAAFMSFQLGVTKPDVRIFEHMFEDLGVQPERTTFFDDTEENLRVARSLGMRAERVRGVAELRARLVALGML